MMGPCGEESDTATVTAAGLAAWVRGYRRETWWGDVAGLETLTLPLKALTVAEGREIHRWHPRHNSHCPVCATRPSRR